MHTLPETLQMQAQNVLSAAQQHCGALSGVYVHGSVCLGGYTPGRSDLDILIVCKQSMSRQARIDFADALLKIHNAPCPVELSVLTEEGLAHASPICTFHFSSMWAPRYAAHDETNPLLDADFPDDDIPAYFRVARENGIRLYGEKAAALLPDVSDETFYASITDGIADYSFDAYDSFASNILTLPRILSFACTRKVLTKLQGAHWAAELYPQYADLLARAEKEYLTGKQQSFSFEELDAYRNLMIALILKGLR